MSILKRIFNKQQSSHDKIIDTMFDRLLSKGITEMQVADHCRNTNFVEFMCKNCGDKYNSLAISRNNGDYCKECGCWLCFKCRGELCAECQQKTKISGTE